MTEHEKLSIELTPNKLLRCVEHIDRRIGRARPGIRSAARGSTRLCQLTVVGTDRAIRHRTEKRGVFARR